MIERDYKKDRLLDRQIDKWYLLNRWLGLIWTNVYLLQDSGNYASSPEPWGTLMEKEGKEWKEEGGG